MAEVPVGTTWAVTWLLDSFVMFFVYNFPVLHDEEGKLRWGELLHNCSGSRPWLFPHQLSHVHSALWSHDLFPFHMCTLYLTSVWRGTFQCVLAHSTVCSAAGHLLFPWFPSSSRIPPPLARLPSSTSLHYQASSSTLVSFHFFFCRLLCPFFPLLFDAPASTTTAPLNGPTSNSSSVQVDMVPMSLHTCTCALTNRSRAAEWSSCRGD